MRTVESNRADLLRPLLRVYFGPETDRAEKKIEADRDPASRWSDEELDAFWAGRIPAARISARIAA